MDRDGTNTRTLVEHWTELDEQPVRIEPCQPGASCEPRDIARLSMLYPRVSGASFDYESPNPFDILAVYAPDQKVD